MAQGDPIKYSDFIQPDDTLNKTIQELQDVDRAFAELQKRVKNADPIKVDVNETAKLAQQFDNISDAFMNMQKNLIEKAQKISEAFNNVNTTTGAGRKIVKELASDSDRLAKAQDALTRATDETGRKIIALRQEQAEETRLMKLQQKLTNNLAGSYNNLSAQYALNKEAINSMSEAERAANADFIEETKQIYERMNEMQKETGKSQLAVGSYEDAIRNALGPMGDWKTMLWNTGGDLTKLEGGLADASNGVKAFSKQLLKLLMNPVVAIIAAIAVAVMLMVKAFKSVIDVAKSNEEQAAKLEKAMQPIRVITDMVTRALEKLADIFIKVIGWVMKAIVVFTDFLGITKDATAATDEYIKVEERKLALTKANRRELEATAKREQEIAILRDKVAQKDKYTAEERLQMLDKAIALETETAQKRKELAEEHLALLEIEGERTSNSAEFEDKLTQARVAVTKATTDLFNSTRRLNAERSRTVLEMETEAKQRQKELEDLRKLRIEREKLEIESLRRVQDARIRAMSNNFAKENTILNAAYDRQIQDLQIKLKNEKNLTAQARKDINEEIYLLEEERSKALGELWDDFLYSQNEREFQALQLRLSTLKAGSEQEMQTRLEMLNIQREQEISNNSRLAEDMKQDEAAINAHWDKVIADEREKYTHGAAMLQFDQMQAYNATEFDLLVTTEAEKTRYKLQAEKDRWEKILQLNETAVNKMSEQEVKAVQNVIKKLDNEMAKSKQYEGVDLYSAIGLKMDDEQKAAISESTNFALDQFKSIMAMNVQMADMAVKKATERVDKAQEALDAEIEASRNGYANNVDLARKELEEEKKNQEKALNDKKKAQRAQEAVDTVTQTTSLITATAEIWKSLAGIPIIGPALAAVAVGTMWGSFAASKIKAKQMAKQEYGEGGLEFLEGGSHASGNDIPIGITRDGKQRAAEGGEALAIINKRNTAKYKSILPSIIDSLNAGNFERLFAKDGGNSQLNVNFKQANLSKLEDGVSSLVRQGDKIVYLNKDGSTTETYKNRNRKLN